MNLYIIAGSNSETIRQVMERTNRISVVKCEDSIGQAFKYLLTDCLQYDAILLTDQGVINNYDSFKEIMESFVEILENSACQAYFKFVTKDPGLEIIFNQAVGNNPRFSVHFIDQVRIPASMLVDICLSHESNTGINSPVFNKADNCKTSKKSWGIFDMLKISQIKSKTPDEASQYENTSKRAYKSGIFRTKKHENKNVFLSSKDCRKVAVITGHRGSGVTGTAANVASVASEQGLTAVVLDLDILFRGMTLYFTKFGDEVELNADLGYSLIRCLMKPESYSINSCMINENLSVITLAYSVSSRDRLLEALDYRRLLSLISLLRVKFNLVLIDMPMDMLEKYPDIITQVDSIGLCVNNTIYSVINTVKLIEETISQDSLLFRTKSRVIVTRYNENNNHNGRKFSPEFTCELLNDLSGVIGGEYRIGGRVPYSGDFDLQAGRREKICHTNDTY